MKRRLLAYGLLIAVAAAVLMVMNSAPPPPLVGRLLYRTNAPDGGTFCFVAVSNVSSLTVGFIMATEVSARGRVGPSLTLRKLAPGEEAMGFEPSPPPGRPKLEVTYFTRQPWRERWQRLREMISRQPRNSLSSVRQGQTFNIELPPE